MSRMAAWPPVRGARRFAERLLTPQVRVDLAQTAAAVEALRAEVVEIQARLSTLESLVRPDAAGPALQNLSESVPEALRVLRRQIIELSDRLEG